MRDFRLEFSPFSFVALREVEIVKQINQHSTAFVKGIISKSDAQAYHDMGIQNAHLPIAITAVADDEEAVAVFMGVTTNMEIQHVGGVATMAIEAKSGSYLMDINERYRTFQDPGAAHSQVLDLLGAPYAGYDYTQNTGGQDLPLGQFTVQYWETDWAFAKRLASRLSTFLAPMDSSPGVQFHFGAPNLEAYALDDSTDYRAILDYGASDDKVRKGLHDANEADALCYAVEGREIYAVGDAIQFQGMALYVGKIVTTYAGQELVHTCYLYHEHGLRTPRSQNDRMIGASLDAQVLAVQGDEVQVQMIGDENADQTIAQWFPYATVYSSPDGTGWYAMPEPGDFVRLHIPCNEEKNAVVFNAAQEASDARSNPDIKSMRTKYGKEIRFTPNTLVMTNNAGMEISIIDGEGVRIDSDKNIFIKAEGAIDITSGTGVSMLAADSVVVQQGGTSLVVDDDIAFVGGQLRMQ